MVCAVNARALYWSAEQQLAHATRRGTPSEDGDTVIMRAHGGGREGGLPLISFGELSGTVLAALSAPP